MAHQTDVRGGGVPSLPDAPVLDNAVCTLVGPGDGREAIGGGEPIGFTLRRSLAHRAGPQLGNIRRGPGVPTHDEIRQADADPARRVRRTEVTAVTRVLPLRVPHPYRSVRLHSRPHIDLQRVAGALCRR